MSRSNNTGQQGGRVPQQGAHPQAGHPQAGHPHQPAQQPAQQLAPQWQHPADPGQPAQQGHPQQQQAYYFPQGQQAAQPQPGYDRYPAPPAQPSLSAYAPAAPAQNAAQNPAPWTAAADPRTPDPRDYNFSNYGTGQPAAPQPYLPAQQPQDRAYQLDPYQGQHPGQHQGQHQGQLAAHAPSAYGQGGYAHDGAQHPQVQSPQGYPVAQYGHPNPDHHGQDGLVAHAEGQDNFDDGEYEEEEEPKRGKRTLMVVACLIGAIGVGGGLAYGYKTFGGSGGGKPPVIRADSQPAKSKPANAGGKEFPHADKKITEKLSEPVSQVASATSDNSAIGGPRPVQTISISPPGAPQPGAPSGPPPVGRPTVSVPGVTLDNMMAPPPRALPPVVAVQPNVQNVPPVAAPVARPQPKQQVAAVQPAQPDDQTALPVAKKAVPPRAAAKDDAYKPATGQQGGVATASSGPSAARTGGNGFVAVLSSQKSRMDALKVYADLQQKYGEVLSNKPADVQERDLGETKGGVWYRAVVGPPGSREAANTLCSQLKTAGFTGCWVTGY